MTPTGSSARDLLRWGTSLLADAGVASARHDAEALLLHASGLERARLLTLGAGDKVPGEAAYRELVAERSSRVPLQHLTGRAWFRHLELAVGPGVFVPRPETEVVAQEAVDEALRLVRDGGRPVVVDLGTGSGAIAAAVATEAPGARVLAVEKGPDAHAWAARNVEGTGVELRLGDLADAFADLDGEVDVVVSNPPYIPPDAAPIDPEVRDHDPELALYGGGEDGLDALRAVERTARRLLRPGGLLVIEHADSQGESAPAVLRATAAWRDVTDLPDLTGRPRYVRARRAEQPGSER
ncbi:peptide chain release factor N(5)-glutamine methyltransferase [Motilibacter aurantiacus]|uniref:peptide chain release factor N(5)-glutamine methyltransferase n=1 Tax=Motilibacter aurantiacus TaxID=2714955 RepID=UPI001409D4A7|nr:peptide chain release factor N(5)-glutamine methyltransferase [Motilibacter aurantiacus]NHC44782.1 peptide chain release factor N(5)-glutamine methyltransferase [Motilibacter aurantiacus]